MSAVEDERKKRGREGEIGGVLYLLLTERKKSENNNLLYVKYRLKASLAFFCQVKEERREEIDTDEGSR